jgi:hypothetical protein
VLSLFRKSDHLALVWAVLVVMTGCSVWIGKTGSSLRSHWLVGAAVLFLAFAKIWIIGMEFMELHCAPAWLRRLYQAWTVVVCCILIAAAA